MKNANIPIQLLAGVVLLGIGYWAGRREGSVGRSRELSHGSAGASADGALKPSGVTGASLAEKASKAEVRDFLPGRPFPRGGADGWLRKLAEEGEIDGYSRIFELLQQLVTMDSESAREVAMAVKEIKARMADEDGDTDAIWPFDKDVLDGAFYGAVFLLSQSDPGEAFELFSGMDGIEEELLTMVWRDLAREDPSKAESMLTSLEPDKVGEAIAGIMEHYRRNDIGAAIALMEKFPGEDYDYERRQLVERIKESDPRRALEVAAGFLDRGMTAGPLQAAMDDWMREDRKAAQAWAAEYSGPGSAVVRARILVGDAAGDTEAAMGNFAALRREGVADEWLRDAPTAIVQALGRDDPGIARAWVDGLSSGPLHLEAVSELAEIWAAKDSIAASEWISSLPPGDARNAGARQLVEAIQKRDPASALEWARTVSDPPMRRNMIDGVLEEWDEQDPEAAEAATLGLPEDDRPKSGR